MTFHHRFKYFTIHPKNQAITIQYRYILATE